MSSLSRSEIDALKAQVVLAELFRCHGVAVALKGKSETALCCWHKESTPSLSIDSKKGLYHCFGCGKAGDHISFLQEHVGLSFAKAIEELRRLSGQVIDDPHDEEQLPYELLARLAEVWHQAFCQRPEGLDYLESRGLKDKEMMRLFQAGYCDGEQLLAMGAFPF
jgi:DNA primase